MRQKYGEGEAGKRMLWTHADATAMQGFEGT